MGTEISSSSSSRLSISGSGSSSVSSSSSTVTVRFISPEEGLSTDWLPWFAEGPISESISSNSEVTSSEPSLTPLDLTVSGVSEPVDSVSKSLNEISSVFPMLLILSSWGFSSETGEASVSSNISKPSISERSKSVLPVCSVFPEILEDSERSGLSSIISTPKSSSKNWLKRSSESVWVLDIFFDSSMNSSSNSKSIFKGGVSSNTA